MSKVPLYWNSNAPNRAYTLRKVLMQFTRDSSDILGWLWVQDHGKCKRDTIQPSVFDKQPPINLTSIFDFLKKFLQHFWQFHRHIKFFFQYITNADRADGISDKLSISTIEH